MTDLEDEEFVRYMALSKNLIRRLPEVNDRQLCAWWIARLCNIRDPAQKRKRNSFLKFMLHMIRDGSISEGFKDIDVDGELPVVDVSSVGFAGMCQATQWLNRELEQLSQGPRYISNWSTDKRTYVAICPLEGKGALIYMAVAKDPSLGWDIPNQVKSNHPDF